MTMRSVVSPVKKVGGGWGAGKGALGDFVDDASTRGRHCDGFRHCRKRIRDAYLPIRSGRRRVGNDCSIGAVGEGDRRVRHGISNRILGFHYEREGQSGSHRSRLFSARYRRKRGHWSNYTGFGEGGGSVTGTRDRDGDGLRSLRKRVGGGDLAINVGGASRVAEDASLIAVAERYGHS